ncbi:MAG TPA: ROK family transcriptional regulator [Kineosporiaceae bacterium]|nr:ROK family transcriptional regulator [Kineosporiaceae bacterium]
MARRTSRDIRVAHRLQLLRSVIAGGTVSRQELVRESGLSAATVSNLTGELLAAGLLREAGFQESGGGRPRALLSACPQGGVLAGVDVAETYVHVELFDTALTPLGRYEETLHPRENRPEQVVRHLADGLRAAVRASGVRPAHLLGAGVSVPGQVDHGGGVSVFAPNFDWHDVPLRELLRAGLNRPRTGPGLPRDLPLYLDNPLRAGVLAELWFGAGRGHEDIAVLTLGTGVGAGLAFGGSLYRGATNSAGEWGHTNLVPGGRPCHCGALGCLESYVGAPGIMQTLRERAPGSRLLHPDDQTATIDALARGLAEGDPDAVATVSVTAGHLGLAVADLVNLVNPEVVVLGSWVAARLGEPLLERVRAVVARQALGRPLAAARIVGSSLPGNSVSLGAATFALEGLLAGIGSGAAAAR